MKNFVTRYLHFTYDISSSGLRCLHGIITTTLELNFTEPILLYSNLKEVL
ncbi:hypothetical protein BH23THE1_BH23THE1_31540 [soil metagenome]